MTPEKTAPSAELAAANRMQQFGSFEEFQAAFTAAATTRFGSGWALVGCQQRRETLKVTSTANQDTPISEGKKPILGLDVWEHAYYVKLPQLCVLTTSKLFFSVINWNKVDELYAAAK